MRGEATTVVGWHNTYCVDGNAHRTSTKHCCEDKVNLGESDIEY